MNDQQSHLDGLTGRERELMLDLIALMRRGERLTKTGFAKRNGYSGEPAVVFRNYPRLRAELEKYVNGWRGRSKLQPPNALLALERHAKAQEEELVRLREALERAREEARSLEEERDAADAARLQAAEEGAKLRAMVTLLVRKLVMPDGTKGAIAIEQKLRDVLQALVPGLDPAEPTARVLSLHEADV